MLHRVSLTLQAVLNNYKYFEILKYTKNVGLCAALKASGHIFKRFFNNAWKMRKSKHIFVSVITYFVSWLPFPRDCLFFG